MFAARSAGDVKSIFLILLCCSPWSPFAFLLFAVQDTPFHEACRHQYEGIAVSVYL